MHKDKVLEKELENAKEKIGYTISKKHTFKIEKKQLLLNTTTN